MAVLPSKLAVASMLPLGDQATERIALVWQSSRMAAQRQVRPSGRRHHTRTVLSPLQLASSLPDRTRRV
jgi:hypothetical protein